MSQSSLFYNVCLVIIFGDLDMFWIRNTIFTEILFLRQIQQQRLMLFPVIFSLPRILASFNKVEASQLLYQLYGNDFPLMGDFLKNSFYP